MSVSIDKLFRFLYGVFSFSWTTLEEISFEGCSLDSKFANCLEGGLEKCFQEVVSKLAKVDKKFGLKNYIPTLRLKKLNLASNFSMEEYSAKTMFDSILNFAGQSLQELDLSQTDENMMRGYEAALLQYIEVQQTLDQEKKVEEDQGIKRQTVLEKIQITGNNKVS